MRVRIRSGRGIKGSDGTKYERIEIALNLKPEEQFESSKGGTELEPGQFHRPKISSGTKLQWGSPLRTFPKAGTNSKLSVDSVAFSKAR